MPRGPAGLQRGREGALSDRDEGHVNEHVEQVKLRAAEGSEDEC